MSVLKSEHSDFSMSVRYTQGGFSAELVMLSPFKTSLASLVRRHGSL
jgi:hypothetical protein